MSHRVQRFTDRQYMLSERYEINRYQDVYVREVALHHHDFYEIYFFLSGKLNYRVESRVYALQAGDILLISPSELHQPVFSGSAERCARIVLWMDTRYLRALSDEDCPLEQCFHSQTRQRGNVLRLERAQRETVSSMLEELEREEEEGAPFGARRLGDALLTRLLIFLNRQREAALPARQGQEHPAIAALMAFIDEHLREEMTLDRLSAACFLSKYHLSRLFRSQVGTSVYRYILQRRLMYARQQMREGLGATQASRESGFGDYANFFRAFCAEYGQTPSEFLRAAGELADGGEAARALPPRSR